MTVSADINGTLGSVSWSDEHLYLKEFIHKHALPAVVRIVKGQYCSLGVSSISNPSLQSTILLTNLGKRKRLLGQSIKYKDSNKRVVPVGPKLAIPSRYKWLWNFRHIMLKKVQCIAQCVYTQSHAYMTKIPMTYHEAPTTNFRLF